MAHMTISDHAIWFKHLRDDPAMVERLSSLEPNAPVALQVDGRPVIFRKMRDGVDGRATPGVRPDEMFKEFWNALYRERRGERVEIVLADAPPADPYLAAVSDLLGEWMSKDDAAAYDDL